MTCQTVHSLTRNFADDTSVFSAVRVITTSTISLIFQKFLNGQYFIIMGNKVIRGLCEQAQESLFSRKMSSKPHPSLHSKLTTSSNLIFRY